MNKGDIYERGEKEGEEEREYERKKQRKKGIDKRKKGKMVNERALMK